MNLDARLALPHHAISRAESYTELQLAENPNPRCPVVLLLDCSASMAGAPILELQEGVRQLYAELSEDPICRQSIEIALITFGTKVEILKPFGSLMADNATCLPPLRADGCTPLGAALDLACNQLGSRRKFYKQACLPAYRPWIVSLSDGAPNDDWKAPAAHIRHLVERQQLVSVAIGIGPHADLETLGFFTSPELPPRRLQGLRFRQFFRWLADSLRATSGSGDLSRFPSVANPCAWTQPRISAGLSPGSTGNLWNSF